jgi:uncharacterized protein (TIGR02145 family)
MKKSIFLLPLLFVLISGYSQNFSSFTDSRDDKTYKTVTIGTQVWLAENLNYEIDNSWCYKFKRRFCKTYGRLYNWDAAMKACPDGWHLPSNAEWTELTGFLGGTSVAGGKMRESGTTHWSGPNTAATNESGFTALPGGTGGAYYADFNGLGSDASFWSSTVRAGSYAWDFMLEDNSSDEYQYITFMSFALSVRCIKD